MFTKQLPHSYVSHNVIRKMQMNLDGIFNMYEKQKLQVEWGSGMFEVNNGVKQGGLL